MSSVKLLLCLLLLLFCFCCSFVTVKCSPSVSCLCGFLFSVCLLFVCCCFYCESVAARRGVSFRGPSMVGWGGGGGGGGLR